MGLTWSCALWIKPVGCQTFTASSVTRVAKCGLLGIWRFYPCLFGIIMIGGPWWPRFAPFFTKGSSRGATLSFTLRSKGEGGQPRYLILQEIASHFSTPPLFLFRPNTYIGTCMSIEHIYMRLQGSRKRYIE